MYSYSKIMDDCIILCIVHQCNSGNLSRVKLTLLFLQCSYVYRDLSSFTVYMGWQLPSHVYSETKTVSIMCLSE